MTLEKKQKK